MDLLWNKSSAIGGIKAIEELILTRWDKKSEFSPWNCILLSKQEAVYHDKHENALDLYTDEFKAKVAQKHLTARAHFEKLPAIAKYLEIAKELK